ncbi:MAG: hypothetical protein KME05_05245 [Gloeocapsa sp. UFS-A4-WI-NPMV-4B04]|jgi:hypothetical protein|nr:hypothetical protein [Gloeocapsa sp. UFS-A4-WI-NPMV-4B04]
MNIAHFGLTCPSRWYYSQAFFYIQNSPEVDELVHLVKKFSAIEIEYRPCDDDLNELIVGFYSNDEATNFCEVLKSTYNPRKTDVLLWRGSSLNSIWSEWETQVHTKLHRKLGGKKEAKTPLGKVDLLTDTHLIAVKRFSAWRTAVGEVIVFGEYFPKHQKLIYLFEREKPKKLNVITEACSKHGIEVEFEIACGWRYEEEREAA